MTNTLKQVRLIVTDIQAEETEVFIMSENAARGIEWFVDYFLCGFSVSIQEEHEKHLDF